VPVEPRVHVVLRDIAEDGVMDPCHSPTPHADVIILSPRRQRSAWR